MFDDFYENIKNDIKEGIDDFLNDADRLVMDMNTLERYKSKHNCLGSGTYGEVYKAIHKDTGQPFAIKKLKLENEVDGFPITALREIKLLQSLKNEYIVNLEEVCYQMKTGKNNFKMEFFLVFEFCKTDLQKVLYNSTPIITIPLDRKKVMYQLLQGVKYMHGMNFMHRDLKPANILISTSGFIKIADFGLSRSLKSEPNPRYTQNVVTLWYRAIELVLNIREYTPAIDMWSLGCIFYELWSRKPLFEGSNDVNLINRILEIGGGLNNYDWPGILEHTKMMQDTRKSGMFDHFKKIKIDSSAIDLMVKLMVYNPKKRLTAEESLKERIFLEKPEPFGPVGFIKNMM